MIYLRLAWRNIWRNKRRTLITIASVFFAVILAIIMRSAQEGVYGNMIKNVVGFYTGYIQVHNRGYWEEKTLDNSFKEDEQLYELLNGITAVKDAIPRLESFALASSDHNTKGAMVVGIDPGKEKIVTHLDEKISKGEYLKDENENGVLIVEGMARQLKLDVGDTLILIGQGYHGVSAAGKYPVKGLLQFGSPELNGLLVYLPIKRAQYMYGAEGMLTSVVVMIDDPDAADKITGDIEKKLNDNYEVMSWTTMMPELIQFIQADKAGGIIIIGILYMIIAFGIFGTLLMMTMERRHEFGVLIAIGMKRLKLSMVMILEALMLSIVGALTGAVASIPIVYYFSVNPIRFTGDMAEAYERFGIEPIMPFKLDLAIMLSQGEVVLVIVMILVMYPFSKILRLNEIEAIGS
ncbi:hypothetical protein LCGC14_1607470 [marine sediment metagenome]|uniref:Uncharacterized protein n=1 Tax=marine sediment metagenome TaxID=412755 RepID=A0A0F9L9C6_9ZZZZ|nr:ABC transporter permease [bacterium]